MAISCVVSELFDFEECHDLEIHVRGHSKWDHAIDWVWFPIGV